MSDNREWLDKEANEIATNARELFTDPLIGKTSAPESFISLQIKMLAETYALRINHLNLEEMLKDHENTLKTVNHD